jgi:hypothetical protein
MNFIAEVWQSLTREQQRMVWIVAGGLVLTLLAYILISGLVALAVAAVYAYLVGRSRATHRSEVPEPPPEPARSPGPGPTPETQRRPPPEHGGTSRAQTPLGRLFAERPAWSGRPVGPYEPPTRRRRPAAPEDEQLTTPLQEPYDSR